MLLLVVVDGNKQTTFQYIYFSISYFANLDKKYAELNLTDWSEIWLMQQP